MKYPRMADFYFIENATETIQSSYVIIFFQTPKKKDRGEGLNDFLKTVCGFQMDLCEEK